jgi:DNA-binding transcriptional LysR family regulator
MHISQVDLNLFVVLETIYTAGGITKAAETLHLSQSAISHALSRLREIFKDPLFVRQGNIMVPTPFARSIIEPIRNGIASLETSLRDVNYFDPYTAKKSFKLGMSSSYETLVLPKVMEYIAIQAPQVDVTVCSWNRRNLETEFLSGNIDVALDVCAPVADGVKSKRFSSHEFVVLARANHPSLQADVPICLETYLKHEHILVTSHKNGLGLEDIALSQQNRSRNIRLRCLSYFSGCEVVSRTNLLLTAPTEVAANYHKEFKNQISPFPFASAFDIFLYWHTNMENDPANAWLRHTLLSAGNSIRQNMV